MKHVGRILVFLLIGGSTVYGYREHLARVQAETYMEGLAKSLRLCEGR